MTKGVERQREVLPGVTGLGLMDGRATPSLLFVKKSACHQRREILHTGNSINRSCYNCTSEQGDIISQPMPAGNYGVTGVLLQVFTACSLMGTALWIIHETATSVWLVKQPSQYTNPSLKVDCARPHLSCHINIHFQFMNKQSISLSSLFMEYKPKKLAYERFSFLILLCVCKLVSEKVKILEMNASFALLKYYLPAE